MLEKAPVRRNEDGRFSCVGRQRLGVSAIIMSDAPNGFPAAS